MHILFVSHKYPPAVGGMEKHSYELITGFEKRNNTVTKLVFTHDENIIIFFLKLRWRVRNILRENPSIQAIHLNDGLLATIWNLIQIKTNIPIFVTLHGLDVVFPLSIYQTKIVPRFNAFTKLICVSQATKDAAIKRGLLPEKLEVIVNGVDVLSEELSVNQPYTNTEIESLIKNRKCLVSIGRPVPRKGFSWFASEVMPLLGPEYLYIHIGKLPNRGRFESLLIRLFPRIYTKISLFFGITSDVDKLKVAASHNKNIFLAGQIEEAAKAYLLSKAALFIMPNIEIVGDMEGFGLVALEAAIQNKIVLASHIEGITSAIHHGKNGFFVKPSDPESWKMAIEKYSNFSSNDFDPRDYTAQHFSWSKMIDAYEKLISANL